MVGSVFSLKKKSTRFFIYTYVIFLAREEEKKFERAHISPYFTPISDKKLGVEEEGLWSSEKRVRANAGLGRRETGWEGRSALDYRGKYRRNKNCLTIDSQISLQEKEDRNSARAQSKITLIS